MGGRHVIPESRGFDPDEVLNLGRQLDNVVMFAAPTMVRRLVDAAKKRGENGEGLRTIIYGGGPMYTADIRDAIATMGQRFVQIYGQGESPMTITALSPRMAQPDRSSALSRTPGFGRDGAKRDVGSHHRRRWQSAAVGRDRRDRSQGHRRDARLLEQPEGQCGDAERRLAAHRRCRPARCRTVFSRCRTAPRTSSYPAAPTSIRARSRKRC